MISNINAFSIIRADYHNAVHCKAIVGLMDCYAKDPMGGGQALSDAVRDRLCSELAKIPGAITLLAMEGDRGVALLTAFTGFSTFQCKPLFNIHDVIVLPGLRGRGLAQRLLASLEERAVATGYCKLTLEVLSENHIAQQAYRRFGFTDYALDPAAGKALFWEKKL